MANALGTSSAGIIIQEALALSVKMRPELKAISTDLSVNAANKGDAIKSRIFSVPAVTDFGGAPADVVATDVTVTLSGFKQVRHKFTAAELNSTSRNLVQEAAKPMATAIANHMVDTLAAAITAANFTGTPVTEATADADFNTLVSLRKALNATGTPKAPRYAMVNSDVYGNLLNDQLCNRAQKATGDDPISSGELVALAGFQSVYEYPDLPGTGNLTGFAASPDALVIATRVPRDPREVLPNAPVGGNVQVITEPTTGLSVMAVEYIDLNDLSANVYIVWLEGFAVGNKDHGVRLVSA